MRAPFRLFRTAFAVVAIACWVALSYSAHTYIGLGSFGASVTLERIVLLQSEDLLGIEFAYESPMRLDTHVMDFEVIIQVDRGWANFSGDLGLVVKRGERMTISLQSLPLTDAQTQTLSGADRVLVRYAFEIYSPHRDASSRLAGSSEAQLEVIL